MSRVCGRMFLNVADARSNDAIASLSLRSLTRATPEFTSDDASSTCRLHLLRGERHHPSAEVAIAEKVHKCRAIVAAIMRIIGEPEFALRMIIDALPIVWIAFQQLRRRSRGLCKATASRLAVSLKVSHLGDQQHRTSSPPKRVAIEILQLLARIIIESTVTDAFEARRADRPVRASFEDPSA